jgi:hypothetical protein
MVLKGCGSTTKDPSKPCGSAPARGSPGRNGIMNYERHLKEQEGTWNREAGTYVADSRWCARSKGYDARLIGGTNGIL